MPSSNAPSISSLDRHLGYWLRFVSNHVSYAFKEKVEAKGVTVAEWVMLRALLDAPSANPSQIAAQLGMTRGAISKLADRLATKGLLTCRVEGRDRRYQTLALTAKGRSLVPVLAKLADQNDEEFFDCLDDQQRSTLLDLLQRIVRCRGLSRVPTQ